MHGLVPKGTVRQIQMFLISVHLVQNLKISLNSFKLFISIGKLQRSLQSHRPYKTDKRYFISEDCKNLQDLCKGYLVH